MADDYMEFEDGYGEFEDDDFKDTGWTKEELDRLGLTWDDIDHAAAIRLSVIEFLEKYNWEYETDGYGEYSAIGTYYRLENGKRYDMKIYFSPHHGGECGIYTNYDRRIPQRAWGRIADLVNRMNQEVENVYFQLDTIFDGTLDTCSSFIADNYLPSEDMLYEYLYVGGEALEEHDLIIRDVVMGRKEPCDVAPRIEVKGIKEGWLPEPEDHEEDWLDELEKEEGHTAILQASPNVTKEIDFRPGGRIQFMYQKGKFKRWKSNSGENGEG